MRELTMLELLGAVRDKPRWWTKAYLVASLIGCDPEEVTDEALAAEHSEPIYVQTKSILDKWVGEMKSHPDATDAMVFFVRHELELELRMLTGMDLGVSPDLHKKPDDPFQTGAIRSSTIAARHAAVEGTFVSGVECEGYQSTFGPL